MYADIVSALFPTRCKIKKCPPFPCTLAPLTPQSPQMRALAHLVDHRRRLVTVEAIAAFDQAIAERARSHPDFALFDALPGAGPVFAPRLLVACGEQRGRFTSADAVHKYAGIAQVMERSGKKAWVRWRFQGPTFLRHTCVEWAAESTRHSFWARLYYQQQCDKGASHQAAVRALAFTWMRILFRCWQHRTLYDDSVYRGTLQRRGSPLMPNVAKVS